MTFGSGSFTPSILLFVLESQKRNTTAAGSAKAPRWDPGIVKHSTNRGLSTAEAGDELSNGSRPGPVILFLATPRNLSSLGFGSFVG